MWSVVDVVGWEVSVMSGFWLNLDMNASISVQRVALWRLAAVNRRSNALSTIESM